MFLHTLVESSLGHGFPVVLAIIGEGMNAVSFESYVTDRSRGSEFEYVLERAKQSDPIAQSILKNRGFQKRMFVHIQSKGRSPEQTIKLLFFKAGTAIAIVLFERLLTTLFQKRRTSS